jgi:hypothetical protein
VFSLSVCLQEGKVNKRNFIIICSAFLLHSTAAGVTSFIKKYEHNKSGGSDGNDNSILNIQPIAPHISSLKEKEINGFRSLLR